MNDWLDIHAYVDNELDGDAKKRVEARLEQSAECKAEYEAITTLKVVVTSKCGSVECAEVWKKCQDRLVELEKTRRVETFVGKWSWAMCAAFFFMIFGAAMYNRANGGGLRASDVTRLSSSFIPISAPRSQDQNAKTQWVRQVLDTPSTVLPGQMLVTGAGQGTIDGHRAVRLNFVDDKGAMSLFVVQQSDRLDDVEQMDGHSSYYLARLNDAYCINWTDGNRAFLLVGRRSPQELAQIADMLSAR